MDQPKLRTEFSFKTAFGPLARILAATEGSAAAICDRGTWGHVAWEKACKVASKKPVYGAEFIVVEDLSNRERGVGGRIQISVLALNPDGLRKLYALVSLSTRQFYYVPRLALSDLPLGDKDLAIIAGPGFEVSLLGSRCPNLYVELSPASVAWSRRAAVASREAGLGLLAASDNYYPLPTDRTSYEVISERPESRTSPMHILTKDEWLALFPGIGDGPIATATALLNSATAALPRAEMVHYARDVSLADLCAEGARERGLDISQDPYASRLKRELDLIIEKNFEDYFYVLWDMCGWARKRMLVGPARGSAAGSLVCYLLQITDVEPIRHTLLFERFIDVTRKDLPDIDVDFPDDRREEVIEYVRAQYGADRVSRLGTVSRYKAKSALGIVAKVLSIPPYEMTDLKGTIIERSSGDARAAFCIADTFTTTDIGKRMLGKYPGLAISGDIEAHASHTGVHAAGLVVTERPVEYYCAVDARSGAAMIDKADAETLNVLKIDALGLRTLSVLQDCLDQIGKSRKWLREYPLDDEDAFKPFNAGRFSGIFQFEGYALQSLCNQMGVHKFDDIVAITALARPGPLHSGGATEFISRRVGSAPIVHPHPSIADLTEETFGSVVYQEQVMMIGRRIGQLSWEDVSTLRKAMSKSLGEEFFNKYWEKFREGAKAQGIPEQEARPVWEKMCTFGSWAFNKSHAVSYGLLSYWCAMLKERHPLEFAAACLRNARDEDSSIKLLRELSEEGFKFSPVDPDNSTENWSVVDGKLVGGLTNVKGLGQKTATDIMRRRRSGEALTAGQKRLLADPKTPYDAIFQTRDAYGEIYLAPTEFGFKAKKIHLIKEIQTEDGFYTFIAKLVEKNLRDLNEYGNVVKRGGRQVTRNNLFLNLVIEDDSDKIIATIDRWKYPKFGAAIVESGKIGEYYIWKGEIRRGWRKIYVVNLKKLPQPGEGLDAIRSQA